MAQFTVHTCIQYRNIHKSIVIRSAVHVHSDQLFMYVSSTFNPWHACAARVMVLGQSVCMCQSNLASGASIRPENIVTYSAGNRGQTICGFFSETAPLQRSSTPSVEGHMYSQTFSV